MLTVQFPALRANNVEEFAKADAPIVGSPEKYATWKLINMSLPGAPTDPRAPYCSL